MGLSEIAAGIEVTEQQADRGVATVDTTETPLVERLEPFADALPCSRQQTASIVEAYADGASIGDAATVAGVTPMTAAKTLHLLGVEGVTPLSPTAREILRDWLAGEIARSTARELTDTTETEFLLAAFVETHEPLDGAVEAIEPELGLDGVANVEKQKLLGDTMSGVDELL